jgi:hypothetical protein
MTTARIAQRFLIDPGGSPLKVSCGHNKLSAETKNVCSAALIPRLRKNPRGDGVLKGHGFKPCRESFGDSGGAAEAAPFQTLNADLRVFPQPARG